MQDLDANPYLEQEVLSASPARLRWLLLRKSVDLCKVVDQLWSKHQDAIASQWLLRIREILGELLSGVTGTDELSQQVSELYVFSLRLLNAAETERNVGKLHQLRDILQIEEETWQLVQRHLSPIGLEPAKPTTPYVVNSSSLPFASGSFSLEV